jgi:hypothetical protein
MRSTQFKALSILLTILILASALPAAAWTPVRQADSAPVVAEEDINIGQIVRDLAQTAEAQSQAAEPLWVPPSAAPGFYAARDWRNIDAATHGIVGGHQSFYWDELNPVENVYNWNLIDDFLNRNIVSGKKAAFGIVTFNGRANEGRDDDPPIRVPAWVFAAGATKVQAPGNGAKYPIGDPRRTNPPAFEIPRYWNAVYKAKYDKFIAALGARYDGDPRVEYIQIGIGKFGETQPCDDGDDSYVLAALQADRPDSTVYTWAYIVRDELTPIYDRAFNTTRLVLPNAPTFGNDKGGFKLWTDDAIARGIGLFPAGLLAIQEGIDYRTKPGWNGIGKFDQILTQVERFEQGVGPEQWVPLSQEAYNYMTPSAIEFYWAVLGALRRRVDYITVEHDVWYASGGVPRADFADYVRVMQWASQYMGKPLAQSPSVWVALREDGYADSWFPQKGNYSWFLYQDDSVAGGRTVPTTYRSKQQLVFSGYWPIYGESLVRPEIEVNQTFLGGPTGQSFEGWMTRRTDQASGSTIMGFKIDDKYHISRATNATIKVTYLDRGTDSWRLIYDAVSNANQVAGTVVKTNSGTWKTATFTVTDAYFGNRQTGGTDLRIDCMSDGNEYIHMVDVNTGQVPTPTPTATRDPNITPSATPTGTTVPTATQTPSVTSTPTTVELRPFQDTFLYSQEPTTNWGNDQLLKARLSWFRPLLRFDTSAIPANATVTNAQLYLYLNWYEHLPNQTPNVSVYKVLQDWQQSQATWNNRLTGTPWGAPGADGATDRSLSASGVAAVSTINTWYNWNVTSLVQDWVWNPSGNRGMLMISDSGRELRFHSDNAATNRPYLRITYVTGGAPGPTTTASPSPTQTPFTSPTTTVSEFRGTSQDTYVNAGSPTSNYENQGLRVYGPGMRRTLINFDVSAKVPQGVEVLEATLRLTASTHDDGKSNLFLDIGAYQVKRPWLANQATWTSATTGTSWGIAGCDGVPSDRLGTPVSVVRVQAISTGTSPAQRVTYDWDVTSIIHSWVTNPTERAGILLTAPSTAAYRDIGFVDSVYMGDAGVELHPLLIVRWRTAQGTPTPTVTAQPDPATVQGTVYEDINRNGVREAGELGVMGATVQLMQGAAVIAQQTTAGSGEFTLTNVAAGSYTLRLLPPTGYFPSTTTPQQVTVSAGQTVTQDFGVFQASSFSAFLPGIFKGQ